ncbi:MAG: HAD-IA family hydrolase [Ilumatobacteraceae bacterium]
MSIRLVVFDCDGVLVDSERLAVRVDQQVLALMGWDLPLEEVIERFVGSGHAAMRLALSERLGRDLPHDWDEPYTEMYWAAFRDGLTAIDGAAASLAALDAAGLPTCVASNSTVPQMEYTLGLTGLLPLVEGRLFSGQDHGRPKPDPEVYLRAAAAMGVPPKDAVAVDDSPAGVAAAVAAGMHVIGFSGGLHPADRLLAAGAHALAPDHTEVQHRLDHLAGN